MASRPRTMPIRSPGSTAPGDIGYLLKQLNSAFRRRLEQRLRHRDLDLSMTHMATLFTIQEEPGLAGAQLARRVMVSAQAMNGVLRRLDGGGLIGSRPHPDNRHTDVWTLTPAGVRRLKRARSVADPVFREMLAALTAAERTELKRLLGVCVDALEGRAGVASRQPRRARA